MDTFQEKKIIFTQMCFPDKTRVPQHVGSTILSLKLQKYRLTEILWTFRAKVFFVGEGGGGGGGRWTIVSLRRW